MITHDQQEEGVLFLAEIRRPPLMALVESGEATQDITSTATAVIPRSGFTSASMIIRNVPLAPLPRLAGLPPAKPKRPNLITIVLKSQSSQPAGGRANGYHQPKRQGAGIAPNLGLIEYRAVIHAGWHRSHT